MENESSWAVATLSEMHPPIAETGAAANSASNDTETAIASFNSGRTKTWAHWT